jgi:AbrB family looped-hinge helix DNA binding protein
MCFYVFIIFTPPPIDFFAILQFGKTYESYLNNVHNIHNGDIMTDVYVSKVTSAGQISLPKALREALGIEEDYIVIEPFGDALLLRKIKSMKEEIYEYFEKEAKIKGITKEKLEKALKKSSRKILKELYDAQA